MDSNSPSHLRATPIPEPFSHQSQQTPTEVATTPPHDPSKEQSEDTPRPISLSEARDQIDHSISPLELQIFLAQQFATASLSETARAGHFSLTAMELARAAATINNTVLPYTHSRLSPADSSANTNQTESMLNDIAIQRAKHQQQLALQNLTPSLTPVITPVTNPRQQEE